MSMPRYLAAAAVTAVTVCAGAMPALAASRPSSASAVHAGTPLTAAIAEQTPLVQILYSASPRTTDTLLYQSSLQVAGSIHQVQRVHADDAQRPSQLEWLLGAGYEIRGENAIQAGEYAYVYDHPTRGAKELRAGLADLRFSNFYLGHADSQLGVAHRDRNAEPVPFSRTSPEPPGPGTLRTPYGLVATIEMATGVLHEALPGQIVDASVDLNEAAARYYSTAVARMHVDRAQGSAAQEWVRGVQTQLRGDELLARGLHSVLHTSAKAAIGNREITQALGILREGSSEIARADTALHVPTSGPSVSIPAHITYYRG